MSLSSETLWLIPVVVITAVGFGVAVRRPRAERGRLLWALAIGAGGTALVTAAAGIYALWISVPAVIASF